MLDFAFINEPGTINIKFYSCYLFFLSQLNGVLKILLIHLKWYKFNAKSMLPHSINLLVV